MCHSTNNKSNCYLDLSFFEQTKNGGNITLEVLFELFFMYAVTLTI